MLRKVAELRRAVGWPAMTAATVLLSLTALCMLALTLATWQPDNNPRWVLYVLVVVALGGLAWTVRRGALLEPREVAAMVSLCFVALAVLTWGTERQVAVLANGTSTPTLAVFAVWFLPLALARVVSYVGTALWVLAVASHHDPQMLGPTVAVVVQVLVGTEVLGRLRLRLDRLARTDQLTGALNRWGVQAVVDAQLVRRRRLGTPLTVLALDVDDLRAVNTLGGHAAGDRLLTSVVEHLRAGLREGDVLGRLGGDEFLVVMPGADHGVADVVARRLQVSAPASWSCGVAQARADDDVASLLARADDRMYAQKQGRRPESGQT